MLNIGVMLWMIYLASFSLVSMLKFHKHILITLMSLEFLSLNVYVGVYFLSKGSPHLLFFSLWYLTLAVCEGVLGISLMVSMIRNLGKETYQVLHLNLW